MTASQCRQLIDSWLDPALSDSQKREIAREIEAHLDSFPELRPSWKAAQQTLQTLQLARSFEAPPPTFLRANVRAALVAESAKPQRQPFWLALARPIWAGGALAACALLLVARDFVGPNATVVPLPQVQEKAPPIASRPPRHSTETIEVLPSAPKIAPRPRVFVEPFQPSPPPVVTLPAREIPPIPVVPRAKPAPIITAPAPPKLAPATRQNTNNSGSGFQPPRGASAQKSATSQSAPAHMAAPSEPLLPAPANGIAAPNFRQAPPATTESFSADIAPPASAPRLGAPSASLHRSESVSDKNLDFNVSLFTVEVIGATREENRENSSARTQGQPPPTVQIRLQSKQNIANVRILQADRELWRGDLSAQKPLELQIAISAAAQEIELELEKLSAANSPIKNGITALEKRGDSIERITLRAKVGEPSQP